MGVVSSCDPLAWEGEGGREGGGESVWMLCQVKEERSRIQAWEERQTEALPAPVPPRTSSWKRRKAAGETRGKRDGHSQARKILALIWFSFTVFCCP